MMLDGNKRIEIKNSSIIILALLLLAIHFIADFLPDKRLAIAEIYIVILGISVYLCAEKTSFYESVYNLIVLLILGEILKNCVPYFKNLKWIFETLVNQFKFPGKAYINAVLSTPYIFFYLIGVLLLFICICAPNLCQPVALKNVLDVLGKYSVWAIATHMFAVCFTKYELIENVIFFVFIFSAFWTAYTKEKFKASAAAKAVLLVVEISVFILLYPEQYVAFVENFQIAKGLAWIYFIGLFLICVLCILSEKIIQDIMIGFILLGTNVLFLYGMLKQVTIEPTFILFFHVAALSFYYIAENIFACDNESQKKRYLKAFLAVCYMMAFLLTVFIANHFTKSIIILFIGLLFIIIYFGKTDRIRGTIYGTVIYGTIPWILLETTMNSLGKMNVSLFSGSLFTILFWCICSVALSWKDTANIKAIAFEKSNSEMIINGLSGIAYLFTVLVLFV